MISFDSALHDFENTEHFLRYAYVGMRECLKCVDSNIYSKILSGDSFECTLSEIFHEETVLLILSKATYEPDFVFDINRATPSLMKHGYVKLSQRNPAEIKHHAQLPEGSKLYIEEITTNLDNCILISELMNSSFAYEGKAVFRFFYLYQIFELLIDNVYRNEQESLIEELLDAMGDSGRTKDALDSMQAFMSEKKRLNSLINKYTETQNELINLKPLCNNLLVALGREKSEAFDGYFYKIRNFIFHQYRDFPNTSVQLLDEVVDEVVALLPSILGKYKIPNKTIV